MLLTLSSNTINMKKFTLLAVLTFLIGSCWGQDFIRAGISFTPDSSNVLGTFSFDLNRSKSSPENTGKHFLYKKHWYILPSIDMNLGRDVSSSNNNVLTSIRSAYMLKPGGEKKIGFELAPTFHADKNFYEQLFYFNPKIYYNQVCTKFDNYRITGGIDRYLKREFILGFGASSNLGIRYSRIENSTGTSNVDNNYVTLGGFLESSLRFKKAKSNGDGTDTVIKTWTISITASGFGVITDRTTIDAPDFVHYIKVSIDRQLVENIDLSLSYRHGTDNPFYKQVHVLDLGLKVGFGMFD